MGKRKTHAWDWSSAVDQTACGRPRRYRKMEAWARCRVTCAACLHVLTPGWPSDLVPSRRIRAKDSK